MPKAHITSVSFPDRPVEILSTIESKIHAVTVNTIAPITAKLKISIPVVINA